MKNTYSKHLLALLFFLLPVGIVIPATALTTDKDINSSTGLSIDTEMTETKRGDLSAGTPFEAELSSASGLLPIKDIKGTANNVIVHTVNGGTLRITNHDNLLGGAAPTDIQIDGANTDSVNENRLVGAVVGVLTTTDTSTVDSHSYALVTGTGDTDNASFQISGDKLLTNAVFDFETKSSYSIRVRSTDSDSQTYEEVLSITVNDITNETNTSTQTLWNLNTAGNYTASRTLAIDVSTGIGQLTTGSFTADNIEVATDRSFHSSVADFNADGHLDIYISNDGEQNKLWLGDGAGNWTLDNIEGATDNSFHSSVADFNGDGNLDLYVSNIGQNKLWLGDGKGNWTLANIEGATDSSLHSSVADFNEDGHLDIYVSNFGQQNKLWLGDGAGNWTLDNIEVATDNSVHSSVADFNDDGNLDIYVSNVSGQNKLWLGDGAGNWTLDNIEAATDSSNHSSVADFNADGHLDIYVSNNGGQNKLWLGDGAGNWTLDNIEVATDGSRHSSVADFNEDGHLDIYVSNVNEQNKLWLGDGAGNWTLANIEVATDSSYHSSVADFNADGNLDIYVANFSQNKLWINGFSQDSPYITANTAQTFISSLTGFSETLSANNQGTVSYQVSTDNGNTWNYWNGTTWTVTTKTDGTETSSATLINTNIGTLDTDGGAFLWRAFLHSNGTQRVELDQVEVSFVPPPAPTDIQIDGANTDSVNENRLVGAVVGVLTTTDSSTVDSHSYALVTGAGDTDNASFTISDDKLLTNAVFDFETKNSYSIRVQTTDSSGSMYEKSLTITVNDITTEVDAAGVKVWNLNTLGDYALSDTGLNIATGIGQVTTGSFTVDNIETATDGSRHSSVADFNADGTLDIYVSNNFQQNKLWLGDGAGNWTLDNIEAATDNSNHSSVADFNGDGHLDIYVSNDGGQNKLWLGDGAGNWTLDNIETATDQSYHSSVADFNADGHLDIYVSNYNQQNKLWLGDGAGNWTLDNIETATDQSTHSSVADFNADGHLDIYVSNQNQQNKFWLGDGAGNWTLDNIEGATDNSRHSSVADFNKDGNLDIYVSNIGQQNKLWLGDGAGNWTRDNIETATDNSVHSTVADFNADGTLDIYVSNYNQQNKLWLGDGAGGWTLDNIETATDNSFHSSVEDFNADGTLDIYVSNWREQNKLWLNGFSQDSPYITANTAQTFTTSLTGFTETLSANNQGSVSYQVSTDNGTTWSYWNGTAWTLTTKTDGTETSSATLINSNIATLDTDGGAFLWRAFLHSNGTQRVELDQVEVSYATELPAISVQCSITPPSINAYGGTVTATTTDVTVLTTQGTHTLNWLFGTSGSVTATTASQTVVIQDTTPPDAVVLPTINQQCAATLIPPTTTDNCAGIVTATTSSVLQINSQGSRIISWTFADGNGNSLVVTQTVVINDSSAPIAPVLTIINTSDTITLAVPTALDNCSGMVTGQTTSNLTISSEGTHRIVWTFTDGVGNQSTAEQVVVLKRSSGDDGGSASSPEPEPDPCDTDTVAPVAPVLAPISDSCEVVIPTPTALDTCSGSVQGTTEAPLTYSQVGDYSITWVFTDSSGNQSTAVQEVSILYDQEVVDVHSACESFEWIDGVRYTEDNNTATYETTDAQGCITLHRLELTLDTLEQPSIALEGNALVVETLADNYQWLDCDNGNTPIAGATQPRFTPDRLTGNYAVRVTKGSCVATSECKQLLPEEAVNASQAFSPNGDGINDTWHIEHIEKFPNASVRVFNKTGNEVFASENGYNNDWNGAWKGSQNVLPSGSYFYTVDREGDGIVDQYGWLYIQK